MTGADLAIAAAVLVGAGFLALSVVVYGMRERDRLVRSLERRRIVVTLLDDTAFEGVLYDADRSTFVLRNAAALHPDGSRTPADGEVLVPRDRLAYLQRP